MASLWHMFGRGASSPTISEYLHLSKTNIQRISYLTSRESQPEEPLNPNQCRSMSAKLVRTLENITALFYFCDKADSSSASSNTSTISMMALQNFYLVSQRAKELAESCCSVDWCQASTFQIHNEEAFKEILLETSLCYSTIYELVKDKLPFQDLRGTSTFDPPTSTEVMRDRVALLQRYQSFMDTSSNPDSIEIQKQHLAKYLMRRLSSFMPQSNIEDFDARDLRLWPDGRSPVDEWGKDSAFLGGNVCKTTWLNVPCAKKIFNDGVREEEILAEAKILAHLNHPNIVKFICCGHDSENSWCHFIAMEEMERGLHSVIRKQAQLNTGPPFPLLSALDIMLQIAYGTCYLHDNGVAHRDLKTSNVVVRQITTSHLQDYYQVKLVDFGLSKVKLLASKSNTISRPKTGTTVYMAPEAFHQGRANWFKADVYSFGIMCSVILSGEEPFPREEFERSKLYGAVRNGKRPVLPQDTPKELACLIKECWDTDRNVRPGFADICTRLAKLRHKLLRVDPHGHAFTDGDSTANLYMQRIIKNRSDARKQLLENVTEEVVNEWFLSNVAEKAVNERFLPNENVMPGREEPLGPRISTPLLGDKYTFTKSAHKAGGFVDSRGKPDLSAPKSAHVSSRHPGMHAGEAEKPTTSVALSNSGKLTGGSTPLRVQDLIGLKRQLLQLLTQNGGYMSLSKISAKYNKLFGRPLCLAEYNAQRLVDLIEKMKDTLVIEGDGTSKAVCIREGSRQEKKKKNNSPSEPLIIPEGSRQEKKKKNNNSPSEPFYLERLFTQHPHRIPT